MSKNLQRPEEGCKHYLLRNFPEDLFAEVKKLAKKQGNIPARVWILNLIRGEVEYQRTSEGAFDDGA